MHGVGVRYAGVPALHDVDWNLRRGEVHVVIATLDAGDLVAGGEADVVLRQLDQRDVAEEVDAVVGDADGGEGVFDQDPEMVGRV